MPQAIMSLQTRTLTSLQGLIVVSDKIKYAGGGSAEDASVFDAGTPSNCITIKDF